MQALCNIWIFPFIPVWSDRIAGLAIPVTLSFGYLTVLLFFPAESGGFGSFAEVALLFTNPQAVITCSSRSLAASTTRPLSSPTAGRHHDAGQSKVGDQCPASIVF